jgi:Tfp pilus assembly protein PilV
LPQAFSLIEVMIAVALMSVIVIGLLAMFGETQRAFRTGVTQVDVMESGRAALEMMAREFEQAAPTRMPNGVNFTAVFNGYALVQPLPGLSSANQPQWRTNILENIAFAARQNQTWQGIGYAVAFDTNSVIGTLCRYETNASAMDLGQVAVLCTNAFAAVPSRIVDGVVHFRLLAYDIYGQLMTPYRPYSPNMIGQLRLVDNVPAALSYGCVFSNNAVPAYIDLELGLLEAKTVERARNLPIAAQPQFLAGQAGKVQIFRQRVPIRNVDPSVYQ